MQIRACPSDALWPAGLDVLRDLFKEAFDEEPSPEDWEHTLGGTHFLLEDEGRILAHASVVDRVLWVGERALSAGYVEGVAVWPSLQGHGHGSAVNGFVDEAYALGGLCTGSHRFYRRLGWEVWVGPTYMRAPGGNERTADEDGNVLVRWTPTTPRDLDPTAPLICEYRSGDAW